MTTDTVQPAQDLDLGMGVSPAPKRTDYGHAKKVVFTIWDGRKVVMKRLKTEAIKSIARQACVMEPGNPILANSIATDEMLKTALVSVGDMHIGSLTPSGVAATGEHLYAALESKGVEHAQMMHALMTTTTDEEDALFFGSIEVLE